MSLSTKLLNLIFLLLIDVPQIFNYVPGAKGFHLHLLNYAMVIADLVSEALYDIILLVQQAILLLQFLLAVHLTMLECLLQLLVFLL